VDPWRLQDFEHVEGAPDVRIPIEDAEALIEDYCSAWIRRHLGGYTGMVSTGSCAPFSWLWRLDTRVAGWACGV
jgi:hypothetical protein